MYKQKISQYNILDVGIDIYMFTEINLSFRLNFCGSQDTRFYNLISVSRVNYYDLNQMNYHYFYQWEGIIFQTLREDVHVD